MTIVHKKQVLINVCGAVGGWTSFNFLVVKLSVLRYTHVHVYLNMCTCRNDKI